MWSVFENNWFFSSGSFSTSIFSAAKNQMIRTGQMTSWRDASKHHESATRSPTHPPPPSSGSRDANEPSAKFSQSQRRPLLGAFNQHKAQVGAFSVIVKTLPMVRLQLYRRACWRDCGHGVSSYPADVDRAERDDFGCEDAANKCESEIC